VSVDRHEPCIHVLVMGVAGSGKSTVASALAQRLGLEMVEGDAMHPAANVEKMRNGIPLTDDDRRPWLDAIGELLAARHKRGRGTVLACSALRRAYRDVLRAAVPIGETFVVQLGVDAPTLRARLAARKDHFMPASLLESQLATLERLGQDEDGIAIDASGSVEDVTDQALQAIDAWIASKR
jgi:gluconokinase